MMNTKAQAADAPAQRTALEAADDEAAEHFHQDVTGDHRDEQSQAEAERADHEGDELDRGDERDHDKRRAVRHEQ
jgi:hypothetical protein